MNDKRDDDPLVALSEITPPTLRRQLEDCPSLEKMIRLYIKKLCEVSDNGLGNLCRDEMDTIVTELCLYYKNYQIMCCQVIGVIEPGELGTIVPPHIVEIAVRSSQGYPGVIDFPKVDLAIPTEEIPESIVACRALKELISRSIVKICRYGTKPLCEDNELTRNLDRLCQFYPIFYKYCCK